MCSLPNICQWICRQGMDADRKRGKIKTPIKTQDSETNLETRETQRLRDSRDSETQRLRDSNIRSRQT